MPFTNKLIKFAFPINSNKLLKLNIMKIKNVILLLAGAIIILSSCGQTKTGNLKLKQEIDTLSYAIGTDIGNNLKRSAIDELNYDLFTQGMKDALEENELKISEEEIQKFLRNYSTKLREKQTKMREERLTKNLEEGRAFLDENKKKSGIITTESGLQYEIIKEGTGLHPGPLDMVKCHYHGTLIDGTVFDSSVERGDTAEFALNRVIKGWTEGLQLMKEGAKYKFYIPTELAYGQNIRPGGKIEENMALIFEVELFEVIPNEQK